VIGNPDVALLALAVGVLLIYAGLSGRILLGVTGGVIATVALARLVRGSAIRGVHWWTALPAGAVVGAVTIVLLRTAIRAKRNKSL